MTNDLTPAQRECLEAYARTGTTYRSIAKRRGTSESAVEKLILQGYKRLGIRSSRQLRQALDRYRRGLSSKAVRYDIPEAGEGDVVIVRDKQRMFGTVVKIDYRKRTATLERDDGSMVIADISDLIIVEAHAEWVITRRPR